MIHVVFRRVSCSPKPLILYNLPVFPKKFKKLTLLSVFISPLNQITALETSSNCPKGTTGPNCAQDINECKLQPNICHNGDCINTHSSYHCNCYLGWEGKHCDQKKQYKGRRRGPPPKTYSKNKINPAIEIETTNLFNSQRNSHPQPNNLSNSSKTRTTEYSFNSNSNSNSNNKNLDSSHRLNALSEASEILNFLTSPDPDYTLPGYSKFDQFDNQYHQSEQNNRLNNFFYNSDNSDLNPNDLSSVDYYNSNLNFNNNNRQNNNNNDNQLCHGIFCHNGDCIENEHVGHPTCHCHTGWKGESCEIDINECEDGIVECQNNSQCVNLKGQPFYKCECLDGWEGKHCEIDIDECSVDPNICLHGGICQNNLGSFSCECSEGKYFLSSILKSRFI